MPIKRLNLKVGESKEVDSLLVRFENLKVERLRQRYSKIDNRCYRYESLSFDFEAVLEVDELGLIVRYGILWHSLT